jgi:hypothetical protein
MNIDDYGRITKSIIKPINSLDIRHMINLGNYRDIPDKGICGSLIYEYDFTDKRTRLTKKGISIFSEDAIVFNASRKLLDENEPKNGFFYLYPKYFVSFLDMLTEGKKWLVESEYAKLFTVDQEGKTVGLTDEKIMRIVRSGNFYIMIKPSVIVDTYNVTYQGIQLKSDNGLLGNLTGEEYLAMEKALKEVCNNFYQCSLSLFNLGLTLLNTKSNTNGGV